MSSRLGTIVLLVMWIAQVVCVAPLAEVAAGPNRVTVWMQVENWQALIAHQVQRLALGQRCGRGRGRGRCIRRVRRHRCRRRQEEVVWHRLKPVLEELVKEEVGDQRDKVSSFRLPVQIVVVTPDYDQTLCPNCGGATKCKRSYHSHPQDINLERPTVLQIYREVRECRDKSCQARITPKLDFVDKRERFTIRAKQKAIASVTEDGVPLERVPQRMWRDFHVRVAKSTVHNWVHAEAEADLGETEYTQWVTARFSGMVGIDEVHLRDENGKKQYLAVVVDDHYMNITHIARGDDWIPSTPKRILIYQALDWEPPVYCHVPLVNGPDGKKLGKRHGATSITEFRKQGYLPEALFNFLALLGWSPGEGEEQEIFDREELIERFDLFRVNRASAAFSYKKLDWMNGVYIRNLPEEDLLERFLPFWQKAGMVSDPCPEEEREKLRPIVPLVQERLKRLSEIVEWTAFLFQEVETPPVEDLLGKKMTVQESLDALRRVHSLLAEVEPFEAEAMEQPMRALADESGLKAGQLFGIVRSAVTGQKVAPPLFGSLVLVGREMVLARLDAAEAVLEAAL